MRIVAHFQVRLRCVCRVVSHNCFPQLQLQAVTLLKMIFSKERDNAGERFQKEIGVAHHLNRLKRCRDHKYCASEREQQQETCTYLLLLKTVSGNAATDEF
jgi:hypothetical protein